MCWWALLLVIVLWKVVIPLLRIVLTYTVGVKIFSTRHRLKNGGEWAVVTGATDGIGKAYAHELARDGLNVMLISRNMEKLESVAKEIREKYNVKTKVVQCDFTRILIEQPYLLADKILTQVAFAIHILTAQCLSPSFQQTDVYPQIQTEIDQLSSVACLVNNVGMSYPYLDSFADAEFATFDFIQNLIACNVNSTACMTRIVLPKMIKRNSPGSAIINVSSVSGMDPFPFLSLYGATKRFMLHLAESIRLELAGTNVQVQTVCPILVATSMSKVKRTSFFVPSAEQLACSALNMLGVEHVTLGWFGHALQAWPLSNIPGILPMLAKSKQRISVKRFKTQ